jgi:hypothetical protein
MELLPGLKTLSLCTVALLLPAGSRAASFIGQLHNNTQISFTIPANGDLNPYGVAIVPRSTGALEQNNVLVSNFNNAKNQQGTGTTIVAIDPHGNLKVFAKLDPKLPGCPGGVGLTTALVVLRAGWVIVGSLPTTDGMIDTAKPGCLIVLNSHGRPVETIAGGAINGPWDMTAVDKGDSAVLFVTNVLNGTVNAFPNPIDKGTVVRIRLSLPEEEDQDIPEVSDRTVIADGFMEKGDPNALVIGPTGLGLGRNGTLYVADTLSNRIAAIPNALFARGPQKVETLSEKGKLNGPLGLAIAPNGDIVTVNSLDGNMVEVSPAGQQVDFKNVDTTNTGAGVLFGLAIAPDNGGIYFVNDGNNTLNLLH